MKLYHIFPTILTEFNYTISDSEAFIVEKELKKANQKDYTPIQTKDDLYNQIPDFTRFILEVSDNILTHTYKYSYDNIEITNMWANKLERGQTHAPHTHSNNIMSGVYYLKGGSPIQFFDPRPQAHVFYPRVAESNYENSCMFEFESDKGWGVMFPSWLQHWVPSTPNSRVSISWNVLLRGNYGGINTLQNAKI